MKKLILLTLSLFLLSSCSKSNDYKVGYGDCIDYLEQALKLEDIRVIDQEAILLITKHAYLSGYQDGLQHTGDLNDSQLEESWEELSKNYKDIGKYE